MTRFYADENFTRGVVVQLRRRGCDVLTCHEAGRANAGVPDDDVLAFATAEGHAVLTMNRRHFVRLHQSTPRHAGIVACTYDRDYASLADRIVGQVATAAGLGGRLVHVYLPSVP